MRLSTYEIAKILWETSFDMDLICEDIDSDAEIMALKDILDNAPQRLMFVLNRVANYLEG